MGKIWAEEESINVDRMASGGSSGVSETFADTPGELFRVLRKEYGRCISKVYRDTKDGAKACGWVFLSRQKYEDARSPKDTYLREVWVTLHERPPQTTVETFPLYID